MVQRELRMALTAVAGAWLIVTAVKASDGITVADVAMTGDRTAVVALLKVNPWVHGSRLLRRKCGSTELAGLCPLTVYL